MSHLAFTAAWCMQHKDFRSQVSIGILFLTAGFHDHVFRRVQYFFFWGGEGSDGRLADSISCALEWPSHFCVIVYNYIYMHVRLSGKEGLFCWRCLYGCKAKWPHMFREPRNWGQDKVLKLYTPPWSFPSHCHHSNILSSSFAQYITEALQLVLSVLKLCVHCVCREGVAFRPAVR